jgi:cellulose synthase/poly-beta-1,6-N-acetylglucosamine synthase-like glycosyltransferase
MTRLVFWVVVGIVFFAYAGFPLLVMLIGALRRRRHRREDVTPRASVLIAAYNEAGGIAAKVRNTLDQDYPADRLEVVVVDDASTDGTADAVEAIRSPRARVIRMSQRGGKVAAINAGVGACSGEVFVFSDANAELAPDAVRRLVAPFADPGVGGVCGNQRNAPGNGALARGERLYWEYDKLVKHLESRTGSIVAADGSIYAIRRRHFEPVPAGVTDDFFISTAVVKHGARLVFAPDAQSIETPLERGEDHFRRRVRITEQALLSLLKRRELLNPFRYGLYSLVLIGHKVVRRAASPLLLLLLPLNLLLIGQGGIYDATALAQVAVYSAALLGAMFRGRAAAKLLSVPYYFVLGNLATAVGIVRFLSGRRSLMWEPVRR